MSTSTDKKNKNALSNLKSICLVIGFFIPFIFVFLFKIITIVLNTDLSGDKLGEGAVLLMTGIVLIIGYISFNKDTGIAELETSWKEYISLVLHGVSGIFVFFLVLNIAIFMQGSCNLPKFISTDTFSNSHYCIEGKLDKGFKEVKKDGITKYRNFFTQDIITWADANKMEEEYNQVTKKRDKALSEIIKFSGLLVFLLFLKIIFFFINKKEKESNKVKLKKTLSRIKRQITKRINKNSFK